MIGQSSTQTESDSAASQDEQAARADADSVGDAAAERTPMRAAPPESGGRDGPEPTRYGDWEKNGRCIDF